MAQSALLTALPGDGSFGWPGEGGKAFDRTIPLDDGLQPLLAERGQAQAQQLLQGLNVSASSTAEFSLAHLAAAAQHTGQNLIDSPPPWRGAAWSPDLVRLRATLVGRGISGAFSVSSSAFFAERRRRIMENKVALASSLTEILPNQARSADGSVNTLYKVMQILHGLVNDFPICAFHRPASFVQQTRRYEPVALLAGLCMAKALQIRRELATLLRERLSQPRERAASSAAGIRRRRR